MRGFNLVIERLFISGLTYRRQTMRDDILKFQSRNREAFHFRAAFRLDVQGWLRFNLVIERLFISGQQIRCCCLILALFQSRNREAFHFRAVPAEPLTRLG